MKREMAAVTALLLMFAGIAVPQAAAKPDPLPTVTPTPQQLTRLGSDVPIPDRVRVLAGRSVDRSTIDTVRASLRGAGARAVDVVTGASPASARNGTFTVVIGSLADAGIRNEAARSRVRNPKPQGYGLVIRKNSALLAGADSDGSFYAAQTLRQLLAHHTLPRVSVVDEPALPIRGSIEGFYGAPWSHDARLDQLRFYGQVKMNSYVYTPKDDPYLRDRWREEYPADKLGEIEKLVNAAKANHVRFTYAVSPGLSICFSDPNDVKALERKLDSVYRIGVREFSVPLDDIEYGKWNCAGDEKKYGKSSPGAAGRAQVDLLNAVQRDFVRTHEGVGPLQTVPTEYSDLKDSDYKKVIRENLDPAILLMWTGDGVIPDGISTEQTKQANKIWGRKVFIWDNYPVNDYDKTKGRLLLAPYDKRERGMSSELSGLVLNPMNQSHPSKVALFGGAAYAWNDRDYDAARTWRAAADYFSGGDPATTEALLAFFDTEHFAPTSFDTPWQPQSPGLRAKIAKFDKAFTGTTEQKHAAVAELREYQKVLAGASERIRAHVAEKGFLEESKPWLDALALWGKAFGRSLDGIEANLDGNGEQAKGHFSAAGALAQKAAAITTIPGTTRPQGPVKVADTVLDAFIEKAPSRS